MTQPAFDFAADAPAPRKPAHRHPQRFAVVRDDGREWVYDDWPPAIRAARKQHERSRQAVCVWARHATTEELLLEYQDGRARLYLPWRTVRW